MSEAEDDEDDPCLWLEVPWIQALELTRHHEKERLEHLSREAREELHERRARIAAARPKKPIMTKAALGLKVGLTERHVSTVLREGTADRDLAERIASHYGGKAEEYLRPAKRRGPRRKLVPWFMTAGAIDFPFKQFINEADIENTVPESDPCDWLTAQLHELYQKQPSLPADFHTLEDLLIVLRNADVDMESRDASSVLWKRFKAWRIDHVAASAKFELEDEF